MVNILRRAAVDVPEPVRRFFDGDWDSWLRVEEYQDGDAFVVKAEVPGIDPEKDVDVTLVDNRLQIAVHREEKSEHKSKGGYRSEFRYGDFSRTVTLPSGVTPEDIRASYKDGVLEVRVPQPAEQSSAARRIAITRE